MKKVLFALLVCVAGLFTACDDDRIILFTQIPSAGQATVQQYFDVANIAYCKLDRELFGNKYEVHFNDGKEIVFKRDGSLYKIDCQYEAVPAPLVPEIVRQQCTAAFPQAFIVEWAKDDWGWKAELSNRLEIKFNRRLNMTSLDD